MTRLSGLRPLLRRGHGQLPGHRSKEVPDYRVSGVYHKPASRRIVAARPVLPKTLPSKRFPDTGERERTKGFLAPADQVAPPRQSRRGRWPSAPCRSGCALDVQDPRREGAERLGPGLGRRGRPVRAVVRHAADYRYISGMEEYVFVVYLYTSPSGADPQWYGFALNKTGEALPADLGPWELVDEDAVEFHITGPFGYDDSPDTSVKKFIEAHGYWVERRWNAATRTN
jgi:hypothetical protein